MPDLTRRKLMGGLVAAVALKGSFTQASAQQHQAPAAPYVPQGQQFDANFHRQMAQEFYNTPAEQWKDNPRIEAFVNSGSSHDVAAVRNELATIVNNDHHQAGQIVKANIAPNAGQLRQNVTAANAEVKELQAAQAQVHQHLEGLGMVSSLADRAIITRVAEYSGKEAVMRAMHEKFGMDRAAEIYANAYNDTPDTVKAQIQAALKQTKETGLVAEKQLEADAAQGNLGTKVKQMAQKTLDESHIKYAAYRNRIQKYINEGVKDPEAAVKDLDAIREGQSKKLGHLDGLEAGKQKIEADALKRPQNQEPQKTKQPTAIVREASDVQRQTLKTQTFSI